jgi:GT2 family glycosyltransferase
VTIGGSAGLSPTAPEHDAGYELLREEIGDPLDLTLLAVDADESSIAGAHELLSEHIYRELEPEALSGAGGDTLLLLAPGGFRGIALRALSVAELRFERVIVLPTSFDPGDDGVREVLARTRATVFAADPESFRRIVSLCDARLIPGARPGTGAATATRIAPRRHSNGRPVAPRITAIILSHDRPGQTLRAVDSVQAGEIALHTLVLDNNSAPAAGAELADGCAERERVSLHRSDRNLGCAGGRRAALATTDSELVMFLDDDAELDPAALALLVADLDDHSTAAASTATVLLPDGTVHHSGGWFGVIDGVVDFTQIAAGLTIDEVPASGPSSWVPGTAVLIRRSALERHPIDERMDGYYEDNEWSYRVERSRPGSLRRVREARAIHHFDGRHRPGVDFATRSAAVELLRSHARFYERHGLVLGTELFDLVPELRDHEGTRNVAAARLLMELLTARGSDWVLMQWMDGDLDALLGAARRLAQMQRDAEHQQRLIDYLFGRHHMLERIERGGWWQLRERALPLLRSYRRLRGREEE